jgi:hypothetical protein
VTSRSGKWPEDLADRDRAGGRQLPLQDSPHAAEFRLHLSAIRGLPGGIELAAGHRGQPVVDDPSDSSVPAPSDRRRPPRPRVDHGFDGVSEGPLGIGPRATAKHGLLAVADTTSRELRGAGIPIRVTHADRMVDVRNRFSEMPEGAPH